MARPRSGSYYSPLTTHAERSTSSGEATALTTSAGDFIPEPQRGSVCVSPEVRARWHYTPPDNPTLLQRLCEPLYSFRSFWARLVDAFGWRYVALVCCVYGVNQVRLFV